MKSVVIAALAAITTPAAADVDQFVCLQANIYWEARNQDSFGQTLVAHTTLNRVNDSRWPDSICGVVYQRSQFSWTLDPAKKHSGPVRNEWYAWENAEIVANQAIIRTALGLPDPANGATYFHATYVKPGWANRFEKTIEHGSHIFYR